MTSRRSALKVLMFHGISGELPPYALYPGTRTCVIRTRDFESCIEWCTRTHRIITLADMPRHLRATSDEPAVLITFDDGLASVVDLAVPVLRKYNATAVLFVTTGWIDAQATPAIFRLERDLWETPPAVLTVRAPGHDFAVPVKTRRAVSAALSSLWAFCFARRIPPLSLASEWVRFDNRRWDPDPARQDRHGWFPAQWDEIAAAVRAGVLELGAHGVTHTPWSWLSDAERRREIGEPGERLRRLVGTPVSACAYPHGRYDDEARRDVREQYSLAFTTEGRSVRDDPADLLPRFQVPSERPVSMDLVVRWPFAGRLLRKGASLIGQQ